jgi:hypothetical protein
MLPVYKDDQTDFSMAVLVLMMENMKSRDSSVGIALGYGLDDRGSMFQYSVGGGAGNFSLHHRVQNGSGVHPASYSMGTRSYFPGSEADHSPPFVSRSKNEWSYTSTPTLCLHGVMLS